MAKIRNKILKLVSWIVLVVFLLALFFYARFEPTAEPSWGVNFSISHAQYLGFDWREMYLSILDELEPSKIRVMAYWEIIEPEEGRFNFSDFDFILSEAQERGVQVAMVLGYKQPRWPECHQPLWVKNLESQIKNQELLDYIKAVVERYKNNQAVYAWQVENEPFFPFGPECERVQRDLYKQELVLVKSLDPRPIIVTDSGEKGDWLLTALAGGDIFGSTMYREVYHHRQGKYLKYPIPPALYRVKAGMVKSLTGIDRFVGVELQAEPWFSESDVHHTAWEEQQRHMNPEIFKEYADYARRVGFAENYFWGVEWWYWAKAQGHPEMWEAAKKLMSEK